jgi:uncharacterized protein YacL
VFVETVRFLFTTLGVLAGYQVGVWLQHGDRLSFLNNSFTAAAYVLMALLGGLIGFVLGGVIGRAVVRLMRRLEAFLARRSAAEVVVGTIGLVVGLGVAALFSLAVIQLPYGEWALIPLFLVCGYLFTYFAARRNVEILRLVGVDPSSSIPAGRAPVEPRLLDSSVIIDGRIVDILGTGFLDGDVIIPNFVLLELQRVADSADPEKRIRGRRGLDLAKRMMAVSDGVRVVDDDYDDVAGVDSKLIRLGQDMKAAVVTTDFNLGKVAEIKGVRVLNINELANAVRTAVLPGEHLEVKVLREGREQDQGVAYLDDGTMVVIEDGKQMIGSTVGVEVMSVLQNPAGKMIFTRVVRERG